MPIGRIDNHDFKPQSFALRQYVIHSCGNISGSGISLYQRQIRAVVDENDATVGRTYQDNGKPFRGKYAGRFSILQGVFDKELRRRDD